MFAWEGTSPTQRVNPRRKQSCFLQLSSVRRSGHERRQALWSTRHTARGRMPQTHRQPESTDARRIVNQFFMIVFQVLEQPDAAFPTVSFQLAMRLIHVVWNCSLPLRFSSSDELALANQNYFRGFLRSRLKGVIRVWRLAEQHWSCKYLGLPVYILLNCTKLFLFPSDSHTFSCIFHCYTPRKVLHG